MKNYAHNWLALTCSIVLASICILSSEVTFAQDEEEDDGAPISAVIDSLREALKEAQANNVPGFPPLTKVKITLQSKAEVVKGGGITFLIFTLGSKKVAETASSLTVEMQPPKTSSAPMGFAPNNLKLALAKAIHVAKIGVLEGNRGEPKLDTSKVVIEAKFTINKSRNGSIDSGDLLPIGLKANRSASRNQVHAVELTFGTEKE